MADENESVADENAGTGAFGEHMRERVAGENVGFGNESEGERVAMGSGENEVAGG